MFFGYNLQTEIVKKLILEIYFFCLWFGSFLININGSLEYLK